MQVQHYCEHFRNLKFTKSIEIGQEACCRYCLIGKNYLWLCLAKNCGCFFCDRNSKQHIKMHLQQSKNKKSFHSIFINILTAQIICIHCDIQILDLDILKINNHSSNLPDPYNFRIKILPALIQFDIQKNKVMGQLENSQGHKKISRGLTGFFSNKYSHAINSALQFLMQFQLFRDMLLTIKPINKEIQELSRIFLQAEEADFRAIHTDVNISQKSQQLVKILIHDMPELQGYKRKDPFEHVIYFMTKIHQIIKYYSLSYPDSQYDQWDCLGNSATSSKSILYCPLFDNTSIVLSLNYSCQKCNRQQSLPANLNFLKLSIPKKKRKTKQVQKQLAQHRFSSPVKNRRKSLVSFFMKQQQCPFTIAELIIQFLKQPLHKDKICTICKQQMTKAKNHFLTLPQYLLLQINRMGSDGNSVDMTNVEFSSEAIDLGPFTGNKDNSQIYQFQTALCLENVCSYPVIAKSRFNKQTYIFKNQIVNMLKLEKVNPNPYILCFKKQCTSRNVAKLKDCYHNVKSSIDVQVQNNLNQQQVIFLPDFWLCQLKNNIEKPLKNQLVCKHHKLRPSVSTKMKKIQKVPIEVYNYLLQIFKGDKFVQKDCNECLMQIQRINQRKKRQKQKLIEYEKVKSSCYCMISSVWIKKWMNFLYKKAQFAYCPKGNPMPGSIDNKTLLDGQKCKANLHKNEDYKVVNIFIWRFLKQLYGGGPQIRYKWNKNQINESQEQKIRQIKQTAREIKQLYAVQYIESPKKSMIIQKTTSFVESIRGSQDNQQLSLPQQIQS